MPGWWYRKPPGSEEPSRKKERLEGKVRGAAGGLPSQLGNLNVHGSKKIKLVSFPWLLEKQPQALAENNTCFFILQWWRSEV